MTIIHGKEATRHALTRIQELAMHKIGISKDFEVRCTTIAQVFGNMPWLSESGSTVGIDLVRGPPASVAAFAIATTSRALLIDFPPTIDAVSHSALQMFFNILEVAENRIVAFRAAEILAILHSKLHNFEIKIYDLSSTSKARDLHPQTLLYEVFKKNLDMGFWNYPYPKRQRNNRSHVVLRAAIASAIGLDSNIKQDLLQEGPLDTTKLAHVHMQTIATQIIIDMRLELSKPMSSKAKIENAQPLVKGRMMISNRTYRDKIRPDKTQRIQFLDKSTGKTSFSRITGTAGRHSSLTFQKKAIMDRIGSDSIEVTKLGRESPTSAEVQKYHYICKVLRGKTSLAGNRFVMSLLPGIDALADTLSRMQLNKPIVPAALITGLNSSQTQAAHAVLSLDSAQVLIQGPPGTGKTKVICNIINRYSSKGCASYCVAAGNVAVLNVATALCRSGNSSFRLLVSPDFYKEWHEHLYEPVRKCLIITEAINLGNPKKIRDQLVGVKSILCTLSLFTGMKLAAIRQLLPVGLLLVDEASQINISDYMVAFNAIQRTCSTVAYFGDDQQLAPFGAEDIKEMKSVYDVAQLSHHVHFLDTQYRMPANIADFISRHVYNGRLNSGTQMKASANALCFIDASDGKEEAEGRSHKNLAEAEMIIKLAERYKARNIKFRIITPYEGQKQCIELKIAGNLILKGTTVFNIDAFQGQEADIILISLVRSKGVGFLGNLRRNNVMLTRCKSGMVIVSSKVFLMGKASETLVGKLAKEWSSLNDATWKSRQDVLNSCPLPGL